MTIPKGFVPKFSGRVLISKPKEMCMEPQTSTHPQAGPPSPRRGGVRVQSVSVRVSTRHARQHQHAMSSNNEYGRRRTGTIAKFSEFFSLFVFPFRQSRVQACPGLSRPVQASKGKIHKNLELRGGPSRQPIHSIQTWARAGRNGCERLRTATSDYKWATRYDFRNDLVKSSCV